MRDGPLTRPAWLILYLSGRSNCLHFIRAMQFSVFHAETRPSLPPGRPRHSRSNALTPFMPCQLPAFSSESGSFMRLCRQSVHSMSCLMTQQSHSIVSPFGLRFARPKPLRPSGFFTNRTPPVSDFFQSGGVLPSESAARLLRRCRPHARRVPADQQPVRPKSIPDRTRSRLRSNPVASAFLARA